MQKIDCTAKKKRKTKAGLTLSVECPFALVSFSVLQLEQVNMLPLYTAHFMHSLIKLVILEKKIEKRTVLKSHFNAFLDNPFIIEFFKLLPFH